MKHILPAAAVLGIASFLSGGCAARAVYVAGPPAPRAEYYGVAPAAGMVWVPGYYNYVGTSYVWVGGRWAHPPHPHAVWVAGRYIQRNGHYEYRGGRWR